MMNLHPHQVGYRYRWNTGAERAEIAALHHGIYSLTVTTEHGCSTTDSISITKNCYMDIPNVFTPNSDGVNDYFFPRQLLSQNIASFKMQVFSRWGQLLFETDRIDGRGWDGRCNNVNMSEGVYIYMIALKLGTGDVLKEERYHGNVTLIR